MHKYEVGKNRPTETRAGNAICNQTADTWIAKIDEASNTYGANNDFKIKAIADVLEKLANEIRVGQIDGDVILSVLRRRSCAASVEILKTRMARKR